MRFILLTLTSILIFSAVPIATVAGSPEEEGWTRASPATAGIPGERLEALAAAAGSGDLRRVRGVVVVRDGKLVWEGYFNGADSDEQTNVRSASKTIVSALVGIAIGREELPGVDARVLELSPGFKKHRNPDPRKAEITIEDLLTMSSIVECDDNNSASRGNEERMYLIEDWAQFYFDLPIRGFPPWIARPEEAAYGRSWSYCTAGTVALGAVLEGAVGAGVEEYAAKHLFGPMGVTLLGWAKTANGRAMTGGGVGWRARDMAKFGQLYLNDGVWDGKRLLPEGWVAASFERRAETSFGSEYGYLWWIESLRTTDGTVSVWSASGNGGNKIYVVPDMELVVAIATTNYNSRGMHAQSARILEEFILGARSVSFDIDINMERTYTRKREQRTLRGVKMDRSRNRVVQRGIELVYDRLIPKYNVVVFPSNTRTTEVFRLRGKVGVPAEGLNKAFDEAGASELLRPGPEDRGGDYRRR